MTNKGQKNILFWLNWILGSYNRLNVGHTHTGTLYFWECKNYFLDINGNFLLQDVWSQFKCRSHTYLIFLAMLTLFSRYKREFSVKRCVDRGVSRSRLPQPPPPPTPTERSTPPPMLCPEELGRQNLKFISLSTVTVADLIYVIQDPAPIFSYL